MGIFESLFGKKKNNSISPVDDFSRSSDLLNVMLNSDEPAKMYHEKSVDLIMQSRYLEAIDIINKGLYVKDLRYNNKLLINRASCFAGLKEYQLAIDDYQKLLEFNLNQVGYHPYAIPNNIILHHIAECLFKSKSYKLALVCLEQAYEESSGFGAMYDYFDLKEKILRATGEDPDLISTLKFRKEEALKAMQKYG